MAETTPQSSSATHYESNPFRPLLTAFGRTLQTGGIAALQLMLLDLGGFVGIYLATVFLVVGSSIALGAAGFFLILPGIVAMLYWQGRLVAALVQLVDDAAGGTTGPWRDYFRAAGSRAWRMVGLFVLLWLILSFGLLVFVIPGIYLVARLCLAPLALVLEDLTPTAALKRSWQLTAHHAAEGLGSFLAGLVVATGGLLGSFIPLNSLYGRYRQLQQLGDAPAPKVHWLNYFLIFFVPVMFAIFVAIGFLSAASSPHSNDSGSYDSYQLESE